jgi:hypothetical protein
MPSLLAMALSSRWVYEPRRNFSRRSAAALLLGLLCYGTLGQAEQTQSPEQAGGVSLGDSEAVMIRKMKNVSGRNVTKEAGASLELARTGEQKTYWWELPDKVVVGILLTAGPKKPSLRVLLIEVGEPGHGVAGIKKWRSQKLQSFFIPDPLSKPPF